MKEKIKKITANWCVWYLIAVGMSGLIVYLLVLFFGDQMQDWMYLRHQDIMPADWFEFSVLIVFMWNLTMIIRILLIKIFKRNQIHES
jgi:hypothetical protein